jgi:hypothetical protein
VLRASFQECEGKGKKYFTNNFGGSSAGCVTSGAPNLTICPTHLHKLTALLELTEAQLRPMLLGAASGMWCWMS